MRHFGPNHHRSALIAARARGLRLSPTLSEAKLWRELSAGRVLGVRFRRQVPVGGFIADLLAPSLRLVVEVDGSVHMYKQRADARRDQKLRRLGYHVLPVDAGLVMRDFPSAVAIVVREVERLRR